MATYLQGQTDQIPVIQPFQPDFGMVQKALTTLQGKYDQGFASVKNAYNQVLNAPLTNDKLKLYRDEYVKESEKKLKNLASVDLSLYENQAAAENVFAPFWEDKRFITDSYSTKEINNQISKGYAVRNSSDEKVREQYNDVSIMYLQNGLEKLKQLDPDSADFANFQPRRWVPFKNLEKYLNEEAEKQKLKIEWTSPNGSYLVNTVNGQRSLTPFKTWAHNMIGNNFSAQFGVMGTVETEESVKSLMRNNPTLTQAQAVNLLAQNTVGAMEKGYNDQLSDLDSGINKIKAKLALYDNKDLNPETDKDILSDLFQLQDQQKAMERQQGTLTDEYKKFTKNKAETFAAIEQNPENYLAKVNKQRVIDGWATAQASMESVKLEIDPLLNIRNENAYKNETLKQGWAKLDLDNRKFEAGFVEVDTDGDGIPDTPVYKGGGSGSRSGTGSGSKKSGMPQTFASGHVIGPSTTSVTQVGKPLDVLKTQQNNRWNTANENFFAMDGLAVALRKKLGLDAIEVRDFVSAIRHETYDPEGKAEDSEAITNVRNAIEKETGVKITNAVSARNAMVKIAGDYLGEKLKGGGKNMDADDRSLVKKYIFGMNALRAYEATEKNKEEQISKVLSTSEEFAPLKKVVNGKVDVFVTEDVAKLFTQPSYTFKDFWNGSKEFTLKPMELAELYTAGRIESKIDKDFGQVLIINGQKVTQKGFDDVMSYNPDYSKNVRSSLDKLGERFGGGPDNKYGAENYKRLRDKLEPKIVPNLVEYQGMTGKYGSQVMYELRSDVDYEFGAKLLNEASNADNRLHIYDNGDLSDDKELNNAVLNIIGQGETKLENYVSAVVLNTIGANGNPTLDITFVPFKETDKTDLGDYSLSKLNGKHISIELNPNSTAPALSSIPYNSGFNMYGDLLKGKPLEADPILKAAGFDFQILPDDTRNPKTVEVRIQRTVFDEKTGTNKVLDEIKDRVVLANMPPDMLMGKINNMLEEHLNNNMEANKRYNANPQVGSKKGRDLLAERASRMELH